MSRVSLGWLVQSEEPSGLVWAYRQATGRVAWTAVLQLGELFADDREAIDLAFRLVESEQVYGCKVVTEEEAREHTSQLTAHPASWPASRGEATKAGPLAAEREGGRPGRSRGERHTLSRGEQGALARSSETGDLGLGPSPSHDSAPGAGGRTEPPALRCSECSEPIEHKRSGPPGRTCSDRCRQRRCRRAREAAARVMRGEP